MATVATEDFLKNIPLFEDTPKEELAKLVEISLVKKYSKGDILYYEKDINQKIYYLVAGMIKIYKVDRFDNEIFLYNLFANTLISEITELENFGCYANAEFVEDSEVLEIDFKSFKEIYIRNPQLMVKLLQEFAQKTKMLQCIISREIVFDGTAKVAFMLINDPEGFNRFKKQDIAHMLNIQPETLSRILKKLERKGFISQQNNVVEILDYEGLKSIID